MTLHAAIISILIFTSVGVFAQGNSATEYPLTEDSKLHDGVPKGEILKFTFDKSHIFPGTTRDVTVYVPKQYDPKKPACVWVNQDGVQHNAPVVFDNLIAKGEMPVTIYIAASPGVVKALDGKVALDRLNRSFEYDGLGDAYARFVVEELLPFVETQTTSDGRAISLSTSGNDRCIGGSSSGAICAFTAAWERPDEFRRVFSSIGTYVSLRGGDRYPGLIRKVEPKPLRIFLQDGDHDLNIYGGDWWMGNQMMERALTFAGYEVNHAWGTGGHDGKQAAAIFPDAVRWLWKDWPKEPKAGAGSPQLQEILLPREGWQLVGEGKSGVTHGLATNAKGEVIFGELNEPKLYKVGINGKVTRFSTAKKKLNVCHAFGPDGDLYQITTGDNPGYFEENKLIAYNEKGAATVIDEIPGGCAIVALNNGNIYVNARSDGSTIMYIPRNGKMRFAGYGVYGHENIAVSPDQSLLFAAERKSHWVWSYQIQPDGTLKHMQRYCHLHESDDDRDCLVNGNKDAGSGVIGGMTVDSAGRLYVVTRMGIQVCDQAGRVNCIIPTPNWEYGYDHAAYSSLTFGGADFDTLFITCDSKVFKRKLKVRCAPAFLPPVKPAAAPH